jgi:hypothetical protein
MTPKPKGPHGGGGDGGEHPHGGDGGEGGGSHGRPSRHHGNIDASKGITSAQEATQSAAEQGRAKGGKAKLPAPAPEPTTPPAKPDFEHPSFDDRKLTEYALNPDHPVGKNKARVIQSATGLGREDAPTVKQQILDQVKDGEPVPGKVDQHGSRYNKDVTLTGPNGTIVVRTAWIVDAGTGETRLVTVSFP